VRIVILVLLAGCKFHPNPAVDAGNGDDDASLIDASPDAPILDGPMVSGICIGHLFPICVPSVPPDRDLTGPFNTDTDPCDQLLHGPTGPEVCVLVAHNFTVTGTVFVTGNRPLVIAAYDNFKVNANVDLSVSSRNGLRGAGGYDAANNGGTVGMIHDPGCALGGINGFDLATGGGGGAGGSHRGRGGAGGTSDATHGAPAPLIPAWSYVRGGCPGGKGGDVLAAVGGKGGAGGGAILIVAMNKIQMDSNSGVSASGGGGLVGQPVTGGGGGGSGGFIGLDGGLLMLAGDARIMANGGGGAGGSTSLSGDPGEDGKATDLVAKGGLGAGGNGGDGSIDGTFTGNPGVDAGTASGGGGGGGGAGVIISFGPTLPATGMISPSPVLMQ
jgi:hypothetical protein